MIKAYGRAKDIERVRELWNEMRRRHVTPTSITLGCMVDALVNNGLQEEAFELVREIREESEFADILNTVIYSTMLNANARTGKMDRADELFREMQASGVSPDVI